MLNTIKSIFFAICLMGVSMLCAEEAKTREVKLQDAVKSWEQLKAIAENTSRMSLSGAIRELVTGITDPYFGEEDLKKLIAMEKSVESGEYADYWENGKRKLKGAFKKGLADGHIHGWYPDGSDAFKGFFDEGVKQGIHMAFFPRKKMNGDSTHHGRLLTYNEQGKPSGVQETCYRDGGLQSDSNYKKGMLEGPVTFWGDGLLGEKLYKEGKLVTTKPPSK